LDAVSRTRLRATVLRAIDRAFRMAGMVPAGSALEPVPDGGPVREAARADDIDRYDVPSFGDGGAGVDLPVRTPTVGATGGAVSGGGVPVVPGHPPTGARHPEAHRSGDRPVSAGWLLAPQPETADQVDGFLAMVAGRVVDLHGLGRGQLSGNVLTTADGEFTVHAAAPLGEGDTVSSRLGPGVFHLRPVPSDGLGAAVVAADGSYEVDHVDARGGRTPTGLRVVTRDLPPAPGGLLVYSPHAACPEATVEGRPPADVDRLARHVMRVMDDAGPTPEPALTAYLILATLGPQRLTAEETMALLTRFRDDGRLVEFLNLVGLPRFRQYLRDQGIGWSFVYANWEPSFNDSGLFYAGFLIGSGESAVDAVRLAAALIGATFSEELAQERAEFFEAVRRFIAYLVTGAVEGVRQQVKMAEDALWDLEFFEAGRILGNLAVALLASPEAVRALPRAVRGIVTSETEPTALTIAAVRRLGVPLHALAAFLREPVVRMITSEGLTLVKVAGDVIVLDRGARPLGRLDRRFTPTRLEGWARTFNEPGAARGATAPMPAGASLSGLEDVVRRAIAAVRSRLGMPWPPPRQFGPALHQAVDELITTTMKAPGSVRIFAEQPVRRITQLSANVAEMTVAEFVNARPQLRQFLRVPAELPEHKIGDLVPDLVIHELGGSAVVWNLTSVQQPTHLAKTQLFAQVLQELGNLGLVRIGVTHWATPAGEPSAPAVFHPADGAAREEDR
jgi:hypothetical protein